MSPLTRSTTLLVLSAVLAAAPSLLVGQEAVEGDLTGLWAGAVRAGPVLGPAEVTLRREEGRWRVRVGWVDVTVPATGDSLDVAMPDGLGRLRARLDRGDGTFHGLWTQPGGDFLQPYVTPVTLRPVATGAWRGRIRPLDETFSLYLSLAPDSAGTTGRFLNPEFNWGRGAPYRVSRAGDTLVFSSPSDGSRRFTAPYDAENRRITMDFGVPVTLTPQAESHAPGFVPALFAASSYRYRPPLPRDDGWSVASADSVGLEIGPIADLVARIVAARPWMDPGFPRIHSLLVARKGKLVVEEYFYGHGADDPHDLRSASKTITSILAGIAMDEDPSFDVDTPVYGFLGAPTGGDPRKARITVGHLLTHTSGLACDDNDENSPGLEDRMQSQSDEPDWYRFALGLPTAHDPGTVYAYCSAGINLVGAVIRKATGTALVRLFDERVARPLGITRYGVNLMPTGEAYSGGGMYLRPRDLLKLGQLYLDGGRWHGARVVSEAWVRTSTAHQVDVGDGSSDGYAWHRYQMDTGSRTVETYMAGGNGGQLMIVAPELDLVVAVTAGNYGQYGVWRKIRDELVPRYVLGAVRTP